MLGPSIPTKAACLHAQGTTVATRAHTNPDGKWETGVWSSYTFTYQAQTDAAPVPVDLAFSTDSASPGDLLAPDGEVLGRLINERFHEGITVELDLNNDQTPDRSVTPDSQGNFAFAMHNLSGGSHTVHVRARELAANQTAELVSSWDEFTFTYAAPVNAPAEIDDWALAFDTDTTGSNPTATDPTIMGLVANEEGVAGLIVQFDLDEDDAVDASTVTDADGAFTYKPLGVEPGTVTFRARVKEYDFDGAPQVGSWTTISYTYELPAGTPASIGSLSLLNDTGSIPNADTDLSTADATVTGQIEGAGDLFGTLVQFDHDGDGLVDGTAITDAVGNFSYTPEGLDYGATTISARTVDATSGTAAADWRSTSFIYSATPDDQDEQDWATALDTWLTATQTNQSTYDASVDSALAAYKSQLASADSTYDTTMSTAAATQATTIGSALSTYFGSLNSAQSTYSSTMLTNATNFSTDLGNFAGDTTSYGAPSFEFPLAPNDNLADYLGMLEYPSPGINSPTYQGPSYDFDADSGYQSAVNQAESTYAHAVQSATSTLKSALDAADDAYEAASRAASQQFGADKNAAKENRSQAARDAAENCPINLEQALLDYAASLESLRVNYETQKSELEADLQEADDTYNLLYNHSGCATGVAQTLAAELVGPSPTTDFNFNTMQFEIDFGQMHGDIEDWLQATLSYRNTRSSIKQSLAHLEAQYQSEQYRAAETLTGVSIAYNLWMDQKMADIEAAYYCDLADAVQTMSLTISAATCDRIHAYADAYKTYQLAVGSAENSLASSMAGAQSSALSGWTGAQQTAWSSMMGDLSQSAQAFVTSMNSASTAYNGATAQETCTLTKLAANAEKSARDTAIQQSATAAKGAANAKAVQKRADAQAKAAADSVGCTEGTTRKIDDRAADEAYDVSIAKAECTKDRSIANLTAAHSHTLLGWVEPYVSAFNATIHNPSNSGGTGDPDCNGGTPWCCATQPPEEEYDDINKRHSVAILKPMYDEQVAVICAVQTRDLDKSANEYTCQEALNNAQETRAHDRADALAQYRKTVAGNAADQAAAVALASVSQQSSIIMGLISASMAMTSAEISFTTSLASAQATLAGAQTASMVAYMSGEASDYASDIASWAGGINTPWGEYLSDLADAESDRISAVGGALSSYVSASANLTAGHIASTGSNDLAFISREGAVAIATTMQIAGAESIEITLVSQSQRNYADSVADAACDYSKTMATAGKTMANSTASAVRGKRDAEIEALAKHDKEVATQGYECSKDAIENEPGNPTPFTEAITAAGKQYTKDVAAAKRDCTKAVADAGLAYTNTQGAAMTGFVSGVTGAATGLAHAVVGHTSGKLAAVTGAESMYWAGVKGAASIHGIFAQLGEVGFATAMSGVDGALNTGLNDASCNYREDTAAALGDFEVAVYTDYRFETQALHQAESTHLSRYQLDVAGADLDWATSREGHRNGYHGHISTTLGQFTSDQNATDQGYAVSAAWADSGLSRSMTDTELSFISSAVTAASIRSAAVAIAGLTGNAGAVSAAGAYQTSMAAAQAAHQSQVAALECQATKDRAEAQYDVDIGDMSPDTFNLNEANGNYSPSQSALDAAQNTLDSAQTAAKVQLASDLGDVGIAQASATGSAQVGYVMTISAAESSYVGGTGSAIQTWASASAGNELSFTVSTLDNFADMESGLYGALTGEGHQGYPGYIQRMGETDARNVRAVAGFEIDYYIDVATDEAARQQALAATIGTDEAQFQADCATARVTWLTALGAYTTDVNGDGDINSADSSFAETAGAYVDAETDYAKDATSAMAAYSDTLNENYIDYAQSSGAIQVSLLTDSVAAAVQCASDVVAEQGIASLFRAQAGANHAVAVATAQKSAAILRAQGGTPSDSDYDQTDDDWLQAVADSGAACQANIADIESRYSSTLSNLQKNARVAEAPLTATLRQDDAQALATYWTDETAASNDYRTDVATTTVEWISADLDAQAVALAGLHTAAGLPWTEFLSQKASTIAAWWSTTGSVAYMAWVANVNSAHSAYTATRGTQYVAMVTAVTEADVERITGDSLESHDFDVSRSLSESQSAETIADAAANYQTSLSTAKLNLASTGDQAAFAAALAAADLAYQQSSAAAKGDAAIGTAQATDAYIDSVYGDGGDYQSWQDTLSGAENAYKLAESSARETLTKNLATHGAALQAALADGYADALEALAASYSPANPWATRAAADARAESDKVAAEQSARGTYQHAVATAQADFEETAANAEQTRSDTQAEAVRTYEQARSEAALDYATDQASADAAVATAGAGTQKQPEAEETPGDPDDIAARSLTAGTMPILDPADSGVLVTEGGYCTTLDMGICFAAGTPVLMADGTTKPIETLQPGDQVLSAPEDNAEAPPAAKTVERVFHNPPSELVILTIGTTTLRCTPPHLFYVRDKGWTAAEDLEVGDELRTPDGRWVILDAKEEQPEPEPVFNFRVADYHTYFVGDPAGGDAVLVHNAYGPVGPFTPSGAPVTGDSASVLRTIWDFVKAYVQTAKSGEQASSLAGCVDKANDVLWPFGEWKNDYGVQYGQNEAYDGGETVGTYTGFTMNAVMVVYGLRGTITAVQTIKSLSGASYSAANFTVNGGGVAQLVWVNGRAVVLTPALAAELGISGSAIAAGLGNGVNSIMNGEGALGSGGVPNASGGQPLRTQWGWTGSNSWKNAVKEVASGGKEGIIRSISGKVPTYDEAVRLIKEAGGTIQRVEGPHTGSLVAGHIDFIHVNYTTANGVRAHLAILALP